MEKCGRKPTIIFGRREHITRPVLNEMHCLPVRIRVNASLFNKLHIRPLPRSSVFIGRMLKLLYLALIVSMVILHIHTVCAWAKLDSFGWQVVSVLQLLRCGTRRQVPSSRRLLCMFAYILRLRRVRTFLCAACIVGLIERVMFCSTQCSTRPPC